MTANPFAPPKAVVDDVVPADSSIGQPAFFPVSIPKLVVLSICTFGLYEVYWFYKNWQLIKARERSSILPVPRAIFAVFYCYACFARVRDFDAPGLPEPKLAAGLLAAAWIVLTLLQRLPDQYWLISFLAVAPILPVQNVANRINASISPGHDRNAKFTGWNWVVIAIGICVLVLAVIGSFLP